MFTHLFTPLVEWRGEQRISPTGDRGQNSPLADNFTSRGYLHSCGQSLPLGAKLKMGLWEEFHPQGITSPLGTKFTPGRQLLPWGQSLPLEAQLRMDIWAVKKLTMYLFHEPRGFRPFGFRTGRIAVGRLLARGLRVLRQDRFVQVVEGGAPELPGADFMKRFRPYFLRTNLW
jgi:hypothetical protein